MREQDGKIKGLKDVILQNKEREQAMQDRCTGLEKIIAQKKIKIDESLLHIK